MSSAHSGIPLKTLKLAEFYISNLEERLPLEEKIQEHVVDEVSVRRRLRKMQSASFFQLAAMKVERIFHLDEVAS